MLSRRLVHTRGRYIISIGLLSSRVTIYLVSMHFLEKDVYIQVLLLFRRHDLSGSPDSLGQFRAYSISPCKILGPMTLFFGRHAGTCYFWQVVIQAPDSDSESTVLILEASRLLFLVG
jgi:hypothetical protein